MPSLSPFALFERVVYTTAAQPPINADGTSVFSRRGAIPIKVTLSANGTTTCQLPVASLVLIRVSGESTTVVNESEYLFASDTGSVFRIAGCQYHYTLNAKTLGAGSYRAEVRIGDSAVGAAVFGLAR